MLCSRLQHGNFDALKSISERIPARFRVGSGGRESSAVMMCED